MTQRRFYPGIPQVPPGQDADTHRLLTALKEHVEVSQGVRGDYRAKTVTVGDLLSAGIITEQQARAMSRVTQ